MSQKFAQTRKRLKRSRTKEDQEFPALSLSVIQERRGKSKTQLSNIYKRSINSGSFSSLRISFLNEYNKSADITQEDISEDSHDEQSFEKNVNSKPPRRLTDLESIENPRTIRNRRVALELCKRIQMLNQFNIISFFANLYMASPQAETKRNHLRLLSTKIDYWAQSRQLVFLPNVLKIVNISFVEHPSAFPDYSSKILSQVFIYFYSYTNQASLRALKSSLQKRLKIHVRKQSEQDLPRDIPVRSQVQLSQIEAHEMSITKAFLTILYKKINSRFLSTPLRELFSDLKYATKLIEIQIKGSLSLLPLVASVVLFILKQDSVFFSANFTKLRLTLKFLKYVEKVLVYLRLFSGVSLVVSNEFHPQLAPLVEDCPTLGHLVRKFLDRPFFANLSRFIKCTLPHFDLRLLNLISKLAVTVLEEPVSVATDRPQPVHLFRKFLESLAEFALVKLLAKNTLFLGIFDALEHLLMIDVRFFSIKKLMRVLNKFILLRKRAASRIGPISDEYIRKLLKLLLVFAHRTRIFPDLPLDSVYFLKAEFEDVFKIFERLLIKFACQSEPERTQSYSDELEKGQTLKVFGMQALHFRDSRGRLTFIDWTGRHQLHFQVDSVTSENRHILGDQFESNASGKTRQKSKSARKRPPNPEDLRMSAECIFSYSIGPSLERELGFVRSCIKRIQKELEELEVKKQGIEVHLSSEEVSPEDPLGRLKYLVDLEAVAKNEQVLETNLDCLQNLLNQIVIVRHEDSEDKRQHSIGKLWANGRVEHM